MKIAYILIMVFLLAGYNVFLNKKKPQGEHDGRNNRDHARTLRGVISLIVYLISWIVWLIVF